VNSNLIASSTSFLLNQNLIQHFAWNLERETGDDDAYQGHNAYMIVMSQAVLLQLLTKIRDVLRDYSFIYRIYSATTRNKTDVMFSSLCHCCCTISLNGDKQSFLSTSLFIMSSCPLHQPWHRGPTSGWNVPDASHTYRHMDARTEKYIFLLLKGIFPCVEVVCIVGTHFI
jgi:hypothetical protein